MFDLIKAISELDFSLPRFSNQPASQWQGLDHEHGTLYQLASARVSLGPHSVNT